MKHDRIFAGLAVLLASWALPLLPASAQYVGPAAGQKVAFLGDSLTQYGEGPGGYVTLVTQALEQQGKKVEVIPAGGFGNTSRNLLARLDKDVLSKKPDWLILNCGIFDVSRDTNPISLEEFKKNVTAIVDQTTAAGCKVMILTATLVQEQPGVGFNLQLVPFNEFLRSFATERHLLLADLNADMLAALAQQKAEMPNVKGNLLTVDGVNLNGLGHEIMAAGVIKAFGFTTTQVDQAREMWLDHPSSSSVLTLKSPFTIRQYMKVQSVAAKDGHTVSELVIGDFTKDLQTMLDEPPPSAPAKP